jgi:hypothetical protein
LQHITIDRSSIGVINTGCIGQVDTAVGTLKQQGDANLAGAFTELTEAVAEDATLGDQQKKEIVELLSTLASEATVPQTERRKTLIKTVFDKLGLLAGGVATLKAAWERLSPTIAQLFQ